MENFGVRAPLSKNGLVACVFVMGCGLSLAFPPQAGSTLPPEDAFDSPVDGVLLKPKAVPHPNQWFEERGAKRPKQILRKCWEVPLGKSADKGLWCFEESLVSRRLSKFDFLHRDVRNDIVFVARHGRAVEVFKTITRVSSHDPESVYQPDFVNLTLSFFNTPKGTVIQVMDAEPPGERARPWKDCKAGLSYALTPHEDRHYRVWQNFDRGFIKKACRQRGVYLWNTTRFVRTTP